MEPKIVADLSSVIYYIDDIFKSTPVVMVIRAGSVTDSFESRGSLP